MINRRGLLLGLFAAPGIIRASSLMPIRVQPMEVQPTVMELIEAHVRKIEAALVEEMAQTLYGDGSTNVRWIDRAEVLRLYPYRKIGAQIALSQRDFS